MWMTVAWVLIGIGVLFALLAVVSGFLMMSESNRRLTRQVAASDNALLESAALERAREAARNARA